MHAQNIYSPNVTLRMSRSDLATIRSK